MIGGQEYVVDALARNFGHAGHEVVVLAPQPRSASARPADFPYTVARHPRFVSTWRLVEWYRWALIHLHKRFPFDVVHCHSVHPTGYLAVLARANTDAPVVITSHGGDVNPTNRRLERPKAREKHAFALKEADALVSISSFVEKSYRLLSPEIGQVHSIPNGVELADLSTRVPRPRHLAANILPERYLLFLGRLAVRKGVDVLLEAHALLAPERRPPLVLAGLGDERAALEQQVERLNLSRSVIFVGQVDGSTKTHLLQNALAVIIPSREWEAFPLVVLEAYAAGRPIIASDIPGLKDLVESEGTGWLVAPETPLALTQAMQQVIDAPDKVERLGQNAFRFAQRYDWPIVAREYLDLFQATIDRRRKMSTT